MGNLLDRLNLLEKRYVEQQTIIANQQAEIQNKIKFGDDYRVRGEENLSYHSGQVSQLMSSPKKHAEPTDVLNQDRVVFYQSQIRNMKVLAEPENLLGQVQITD